MTQNTEFTDKVAMKMPAEVLGQKFYKAKILFLDVDRKDPGYSKYKRIDVNCHNYLIVDGEVSYIPHEVLSALRDAVSYINRPNKTQDKDGIDHDNPRDRYEKIPNPRFDVTVLENLSIVIGDDGKRHFKSDSAVTQLEVEETSKRITEEKVKQAKEEAKIEFDEKMEKIKSLIPAGIDEEALKQILES